MMSWYAVFVKTGNENSVKLHLEHVFRGELEVFLPKRIIRERKEAIWREKTKVLFPGYVFIRGDITPKVLSQMWNVPDLITLLEQDRQPVSVPDADVDQFRHLMDGDDTIGLSQACMVGDRVDFITGPLANNTVKSEIVSIDKRKGRAMVRIHLLGVVLNLPFGFEFISVEEGL